MLAARMQRTQLAQQGGISLTETTPSDSGVWDFDRERPTASIER